MTSSKEVVSVDSKYDTKSLAGDLQTRKIFQFKQTKEPFKQLLTRTLISLLAAILGSTLGVIQLLFSDNTFNSLGYSLLYGCVALVFTTSLYCCKVIRYTLNRNKKRTIRRSGIIGLMLGVLSGLGLALWGTITDQPFSKAYSIWFLLTNFVSLGAAIAIILFTLVGFTITVFRDIEQKNFALTPLITSTLYTALFSWIFIDVLWNNLFWTQSYAFLFISLGIIAVLAIVNLSYFTLVIEYRKEFYLHITSDYLFLHRHKTTSIALKDVDSFEIKGSVLQLQLVNGSIQKIPLHFPTMSEPATSFLVLGEILLFNIHKVKTKEKRRRKRKEIKALIRDSEKELLTALLSKEYKPSENELLYLKRLLALESHPSLSWLSEMTQIPTNRLRAILETEFGYTIPKEFAE